jgi:23S rRNA pseudouridine2605 synthase
LKRVRYGPIFLPSRLILGKWEELDQKAVDALSGSVGLAPVDIPQKTPDEQAVHDRQRRKSPGMGGKKNGIRRWDVSDTKPTRNGGSDKSRGGPGKPNTGSGRPRKAHSGSAGKSGR